MAQSATDCHGRHYCIDNISDNECVFDTREEPKGSVPTSSSSSLGLGPIEFGDIRELGSGGFGVVCSGIDVKTRQIMARKTITYKSTISIKGLQRIWRELNFLKSFHHPNVLSLFGAGIEFDGEKSEASIFCFTELMQADLFEFIDKVQSIEETQFIIYQILRGLSYIHSANIIHCDLKPDNIFINHDLFLKIGDFGLSRCWIDGKMDPRVGTRPYLAPELLMRNTSYTKAVDMWSVGCILGELITKDILFYDDDVVEHVKLILRTAGFPTKQDMEEISVYNINMYVQIVAAIDKKPAPDTRKLLKNLNRSVMTEEAADFLKDLLAFSPSKRITIDDALAHSFVAPGKERFHWELCDCCTVTKKKERTRPAHNEPIHNAPFDENFEKELQSADEYSLEQKILEFVESNRRIIRDSA